ncbi:MAG TPA: type II toxin-antitoxin system VapC family toxin [Vicinamibacteria bacterium]|nr:type II toxin-antitoxin system VapC family toxin [Vicinamibacteria bacterium]
MGAPYSGGTSRLLAPLGAPEALIHLDTSFLIRALVRGSDEDRRLRDWLRGGESLAMSAVAWAEFLCGPLRPGEVELAETLVTARAPFGEDEATLAARLFNESGRRRGSMLDCMIGATALQAGASLATANPSDFTRFVSAGLTLAR